MIVQTNHLLNRIEQAAEAIAVADGLLIGAGAGMGVDSGLPDFRGREGFWRAYPAFARLGLRFEELADPHWFNTLPQRAWGFYGHRLNLYRRTQPHAGYTLLRRWAASTARGGFVFTSNVDGHFQRAGFNADQILECHGSIHHLQCALPCGNAIWPADTLSISVNDEQCLATGPLPLCPRCGGIARPNILMFGDGDWLAARTQSQQQRFSDWLQSMRTRRLVVIEMGAGIAIATVRWQCERAGGLLIRINPRDSEAPAGSIAIAASALDTLQAIDRRLTRRAPTY